MPWGVSDSRFSTMADRAMYRHSRSWAAAATPACNEKPDAFATRALLSSRLHCGGRVCKLPTVGALGEDLAALLWTDCDAVGN